jgi:NAD(P)-dependent dehydrogenase (short-subunit alcohol dehydrogenase family)
MSERLNGQIAIVTGGARGIGLATVERFVSEGARVMIGDLGDHLDADTAARLGDAVRYQQCDVTVEVDVESLVQRAVDEFGGLDIMFNNAGIVGAVGPITDTSLESWNTTVNIDLLSVFLGMKHAGRVMKEQRHGSIISTASIAGVVGGLGPHAYTAAKHGVIGLTKSVANEFGPFGIRANAIAPGGTITPMTANMGGTEAEDAAIRERFAGNSPLGIPLEAHDIAAAAAYLASDDARNVSGQVIVVDAGHTNSGTSVQPFHVTEAKSVTSATEAGRPQ